MPFRNLLAACALVIVSAGLAHADLSDFIRSVNISAQGDIGGYRAQLGVQFGAPAPTLDLVLRTADTPAEAAILLWLGQRTAKPVETVVRVYQSQKGQGWGTIAQSLGIKPGSADFHALKQGNLGWHPDRAGGHNGGKGNGKGKK